MADLYVNYSENTYSGEYGVYGGGSDVSGDGSMTLPFATINKACSVALDADSVFIAAGIYIEDHPTYHCMYDYSKALAITGDGVVVIKSVSGAYVFIASGDKLSTVTNLAFDGESNTTSCIYLNSGANKKTFFGCSFYGVSLNGQHILNSGSSSDLAWHSCNFSNVAVVAFVFNVAAVINWVVDACIFTDIQCNRFMADIVSETGSCSITNCSGNLVVTTEFLRHTGSSNFNLSNNSFTGVFAQMVRASISGKNGNINIIGNTLIIDELVAQELFLIDAGSHSVLIEDNTIHLKHLNQTTDIIHIKNQPSPKIVNNKITTESANHIQHILVDSTGVDCGVVQVSSNECRTRSQSQAVIIVGTDIPSAGNNKLDGAIISNNKVWGPLFYDRTLSGKGTHGIEYGYNKNGAIFNNYVDGCIYGIVIKGASEDYSYGGVYSNLLINCGGSGLNAASAFVRVKGVVDVIVSNNVFMFDSSLYTNDFGFIHVTCGNDPLDISVDPKIVNNIFIAEKTGHIFINVNADGSTINPIDVKNNYYFNGLNPLKYINGTNIYNTFAAWILAGFDVNSADTDPQITSSGKLLPTSPCIDKGVFIPGVNMEGQEDPWGKKVYGIPNIGADQGAGVPKSGSRQILQLGSNRGFFS